MEQRISPDQLDRTGREAVRAIARWSVAATLCSAGLAALLFFVAVLPFSAKAWNRAGTGLPAFAQNLLDYRAALAVAALGVLAFGMVAIFGMKRGTARTMIITLALLVLIAAVACGIIGWWLMLRDLYDQAGAEI
jgi:hypothetical protein